jgi:hypothetical protein
VVSPVTVAISTLEMPSEVSLPAFVVLLATGTTPPGANTATWRYGLAYSTYALTFAADGADKPATLWIEGDERSRSLAMEAPPASPVHSQIVWQYLRLGFVHILPRGIDHILFVLGIS